MHTFLAGLFGGYWVFGHGKGASSSVNQQIVIYVFARVVLALAKLAVQPPGDNSLVGGIYGGHGGKGALGLSQEQLSIIQRYSWPVFASFSWASVMWIFRYYPETLQPSLRSSMTYMYVSFLHISYIQKEQEADVVSSPCVVMMARRSGIVDETTYGTTNELSVGDKSAVLARRSGICCIRWLYIAGGPAVAYMADHVQCMMLTKNVYQLRQFQPLARFWLVCHAAQQACASWHACEGGSVR